MKFFRSRKDEVEVDLKPHINPEEKAQALLESHLTPLQRGIYAQWKVIPVRGRDGKFYVLWDGYWIAVVDRQARPTLVLGAHPHPWGSLPVADRLLAQKLMMETNPKAIWKMACQSRGSFSEMQRREIKRFINQYRRWWWF